MKPANESIESKTLELTDEMLSEITGGARGNVSESSRGMKCPSCGEFIPINSLKELFQMGQIVCSNCNLVLKIDKPKNPEIIDKLPW